MTFSLQGTSNGTALSVTMSYDTVYVSSTTYKVNTTYIVDGLRSTATMWVLKSGTVAAMYVAIAEGATVDHNYTHSKAVTNYLVALLSPIGTYHQFGTELTSSPSYFQYTGTSSLTIGTNTFTIKNYTSSSPNVAIPSCGGHTWALTTFKLSVGTPTGSSFEIVPYMEIAGSDTTASGTTIFDYTAQITAFTVA